MFPRVIALLLSLLGAGPLMADGPDEAFPGLVQASTLDVAPEAQAPQVVFEIRVQHVRVPTIGLTIVGYLYRPRTAT